MSEIMKAALFWIFLSIFALTAVVTLLGILGMAPIKAEFLTKLFYLLIIEVVGAVIGLFKQIFRGENLASEASKPICGGWWEMLYGREDIGLSFVSIFVSEEGQLEMHGQVFAPDGDRVGRWHSSATGFKGKSLVLKYFWEGYEFAKMKDDFSGFGHIQFARTSPTGIVDTGEGWYTSGNIDELRLTAKQKIDIIRADPKQEPTMAGQDADAKKKIASSVYEGWRKNLPDFDDAVIETFQGKTTTDEDTASKTH